MVSSQSLITKILIGSVKGYQRWLSPLFVPCCRFQPSCSYYTVEALTRFGVVKGVWLSIKRILRCHPLSEGGHDPVPPLKIDNNREN